MNFVYNYIEYEEIGSSTLKDIITLKRGDCTEYAQLFVALARLNSIPAMEVGGFTPKAEGLGNRVLILMDKD